MMSSSLASFAPCVVTTRSRRGHSRSASLRAVADGKKWAPLFLPCVQKHSASPRGRGQRQHPRTTRIVGGGGGGIRPRFMSMAPAAAAAAASSADTTSADDDVPSGQEEDDVQKSGGGLFGQFLAGLTVSLAMVPESLAFTFVAGVPPLVGLHAAGTCPHSHSHSQPHSQPQPQPHHMLMSASDSSVSDHHLITPPIV